MVVVGHYITHMKRSLTTLIHKVRDFLNESTEAHVPDYVPYACYHDHNTILTKGGDLVQTIVIKDFDSKVDSAQYAHLSQSVNQALSEHIDRNTMSVYIQNLRTTENIDTFNGYYLNKFSNNMHQYFRKKNYWHDKFVNTLYISIVLHNNITTSASNKILQDKIDNNSLALNKVVTKILEHLEPYHPQLLSIIENTEGVFSQNLEFFHKIIFLEHKEMPLPLADLSQYIYTKHVIFGHNMIEIGNAQGKKFSSVLTIKGLRSLPSHLLDKILQLPIEFTYTQIFTFNKDKADIEKLQHQYYLAELSKNRELQSLLKELSKGDPIENNYGKHQVSIAIYAPTPDQLDQKVMRIVSEINKIGIIAVREDINLVSCFWAQLPGNHSFINRSHMTHISSLGTMSQLHSFWTGHFYNPWGNAVTLLRNINGNPFFFNFHSNKGQGNTAILGGYNNKINLFSNFLISESLKYKGKVFSCSLTKINNLFYDAICGQNITIQNEASGYNLFALENTQENINFLNYLFSVMINVKKLKNNDKTSHMIDGITTLISQMIHECYKQEQCNLLTFYQLIQDTKIDNEHIKTFVLEALYPWLWGEFTGIFDGTNTLDLASDHTYNIILEQILDLPQFVTGSFICYYLHSITQIMSQNPNLPIIVHVENIHYFIHNYHITPYLAQWMKTITQSQTAILLFQCHTLNPVSLKFIQTYADTVILCKNKQRTEHYNTLFNLSEYEIQKINSAEYVNDICIIRQDEKNTMIEINITEQSMVDILEGQPQALSRMIQSILQTGKQHPNSWLPAFYKSYENSH